VQEHPGAVDSTYIGGTDVDQGSDARHDRALSLIEYPDESMDSVPGIRPAIQRDCYE
jgi:hypothetical protein